MPMERRTWAPTPSDWEMARKALRMARGMDMSAGVVREGSLGGTAGRPGKEVEEEEVEKGVDEDCFVSVVLDIWSE